MNKLLAMLLTLGSFSSFACIDYESTSEICVDDTVFKGSEYKYGAKVVAINSYENTITVRSVNNSKLFVERARDLDVVDACVDYGTAERSMHNFPND